ncbi:hypothetical protein M23134_06684 [Microscilla marina ATCC 23134]|uniref:Uncharacterized protein n=1 Tax=Microscilla marina ATCC 23134 TaxID=313606 RepID=A1ZW62_MICM2|nr:hypothetical protein M23134_06684 [Microscilla marina ATCC 23134]
MILMHKRFWVNKCWLGYPSNQSYFILRNGVKIKFYNNAKIFCWQGRQGNIQWMLSQPCGTAA